MTISKKTLEQIRYTNLHLHTHHSTLDGVGTVKDHISECCNRNHAGIAITDHGVMSGAIQLYKASKDKDFLKKINREEPVPCVLGNELYITRDLAERNPENKYNHITVLVKNETGYKNLCYLTSIASTDDHFYSRPRISLAELFERREGLIVTSGCFIGMIPQAIFKKTGEEEALVQSFLENFGDDFYIELHVSDIRMKWDREQKKHYDQGFNPQEAVNVRLIELAEKYNIKTVIAQDSHMPKKEHHLIQSIMIWNSPSGRDGWHFSDAYYTMSVEEMYEKTKKTSPYITDGQFVDWCQNTDEVLLKCKDLKLNFEHQLPAVQYMEHPVNKNPKAEQTLLELEASFISSDPEFSYLLNVSKNDIALRTAIKVILQNKKVDIKNATYRHRLVLELNTIQRNGIIKLADYFMLLEDVTRFVRDNGFMRGYGRGSGGGSLVAYALDITDVDPVKYGLLFERFLTTERIGRMDFSMPEFPKQ